MHRVLAVYGRRARRQRMAESEAQWWPWELTRGRGFPGGGIVLYLLVDGSVDRGCQSNKWFISDCIAYTLYQGSQTRGPQQLTQNAKILRVP